MRVERVEEFWARGDLMTIPWRFSFSVALKTATRVARLPASARRAGVLERGRFVLPAWD